MTSWVGCKRLIDEVKAELNRNRKCQIFAVYTVKPVKRDVTQRLRDLLAPEGIRVEVLTTDVAPERREGWYTERLRKGMQVCISHPRLIMTGLDYVEYEDVLFETSLSSVPKPSCHRQTDFARLRALWICGSRLLPVLPASQSEPERH